MRRILAYSILGMIVGLAMVLVPLITLAETKHYEGYDMPQALYQRLREVEPQTSDLPHVSTSDLWLLAASFIIALAAYMFLRNRLPHREYRLTGHIPY